MRPLTSYEKVKRLAGWLLRNRSFQAGRRSLAGRGYLHAGCGPQIAAGFINMDYRWNPGVDVVWDLQRALPFPTGRFQGIFSEHCLEHFTPDRLDAVLREFHRVLRPGGRLRIVVPCLETHVRLYLDGLRENDDAAAQRINRVFYSGHDRTEASGWANDGHHFMHDFASLTVHLRRAGFGRIARKAVLTGDDPVLLIDRADRA